MLRTFVAPLALTLLVSLAQAQSPSKGAADTQPQAPTASSMAGQSGGLRMAESADLALKFASVEPADFKASHIIGSTVYNNQKEELGEVVDFTIKDGKTISSMIVNVGDFLGLGDSYVSVDPSTIVLGRLDDDDWATYVNTSKDSLRNAPKVQYKQSN